MSDPIVISAPDQQAPVVKKPMSEETKAKINATWAKKKADRLAREAERKRMKESFSEMTKISANILPKEKLKQEIKIAPKTTALTDEKQLKAAAVATLLLKIKEAREDPIKFVEFCIKDPQGNPLVLKEFHKEWLRAFNTKDRVVIEASRNHGKCVSNDTQITLSNGLLRKAVDLPETFYVAAYDDTNNTYVEKKAKKVDNGIKKLLSIKTKTGRSCKVTEEHPFLTFKGYKDAKDLVVGDWVAVPSQLKNLGKAKLPENDAWLLGVLTGDAHVTEHANIITTMDEALVAQFYSIAKERNWNISIKKGSNSGKAKDYSFINPVEFKFTKQSPTRYFIEELDYKPVNAAFKRVPSSIFTSPDTDICDFLAGYLDTDGSVNDARECAITYWSISKNLLKDVQHLLMRIGVQSYLTIKRGKYKGVEHISWRLVICGYDNVALFREQVKPRGIRAHQLNSLNLIAEKVAKGDLIPPEWRSYLKKSLRDIVNNCGANVDNKYATNRKKAIVAATYDCNDELVKKLSAPINWLKIEEIEECEPEQTWAIEVEDLHNHITDDFITHNTSIVVAYCLWRIGRNPNIRIKLFSQNDSRAKERLFELAANIENNEMFKLVFPDVKPKKGAWSNTRIVVERTATLKDATFEALGITTSATGGRSDLVVLDDVCDLNNSVIYPTLRERIIQKFTGELLPMLDPGGTVISIATPYHMCLPDGEEIVTSKGIKAIEQLKLTDSVHVNTGCWETPLAIQRTAYEGPLVCLAVAGLPKLYKFTPNHRLPTQRGDIPVSELTIEDSVVLKGNITTELTLAELLEAEPREIIHYGATGKVHQPHNGISKEILIKELENKLTYKQIAEKYNLTDKTVVLRQIRYYGLQHNSNTFKVKNGWTSNPKFWRFVGYYLAEGCTNKLNGSTRLVFGFSAEEQTFVADAKQCIEECFNVPVKVNKAYANGKQSSNVVTFNCRLITKWLDDNLNKGALNKIIPDWFDKLPLEFLREFIHGYWIGDGAVTSAGTRFSASSKHLAYRLAYLLSSRFGIASRIYTVPAAQKYILGTLCNVSEAYEIRCRILDGHVLKLHKFETGVVDKHVKIFPKENSTFFKINAITTEQYKGYVTDIQTSTGYFDLPGITSHNSDLNAILKQNPEFTHLRYVVGNDRDPLAPLWPERWDRPALQSLRIQQGPIEFDRAYRCIAFSSNMVPCKPEWIKFYTRELLGDPRRLICVQAYDLALEQKSTADYFAWVTVLYDIERGLAFVADAGQDRLSFSTQGRKIIDNYYRWNPDRIIIEKVGLGGSLENFLEENSPTKLPLVSFKPKGDKYFRFTQQSPWLEDNKCYFHPNMDPQRNVISDDAGNLIKQMLEFPVGRHDDLSDAWCMCMWGLEEFRNHEAELGWFVGGGMNAKLSVIG